MVSVTDIQVVKRLVILIADSRPYSRSLLRSMLMQLEVKKVHEAGDGAAAIESMLAVTPDVMFLDWDISVLSAQEVLSMARNPTVIPNPDLPIIVISNSGRSSWVHQAIELGARQFMVRPISPKMLQQRLIRIVREARKVARTHKSSGQAAGPKRQAPQLQAATAI